MKDKANRPFCAVAVMLAAASLSACGSSEGWSGAAQSMANAITPTAVTPPAVPLSQAKFAFAPVTGAPATVLTNISAQLGREAFAQQVMLVPTNDPGVTYVVKGYLSAVGDASGTILVFVWDVFDRSGHRVHRISGQETAPGATRDPWAGIDAGVATSVARQTMSAIVAWGRSGPGGAAQPALTAAPAPATPAPATPPPQPVQPAQLPDVPLPLPEPSPTDAI